MPDISIYNLNKRYGGLKLSATFFDRRREAYTASWSNGAGKNTSSASSPGYEETRFRLNNLQRHFYRGISRKSNTVHSIHF